MLLFMRYLLSSRRGGRNGRGAVNARQVICGARACVSKQFEGPSCGAGRDNSRIPGPGPNAASCHRGAASIGEGILLCAGTDGNYNGGFNGNRIWDSLGYYNAIFFSVVVSTGGQVNN